MNEAAESANLEKQDSSSGPKKELVYSGFSLVEETRIDGWCFGAITEFEYPDGCESGDGFVVAPDGSRAGIVWEVGEQETEEILAPGPGRWGVYAVWFPRATRTVDDLVFNFRHVLPDLKRKYNEVRAHSEVSEDATETNLL